MRNLQTILNATRTCPACGGVLRGYQAGRVLVCLTCPWAFLSAPIDVPDLPQIARDRAEQAALLQAYTTRPPR